MIWMRRNNNKVADGLADLTMDRKCSWSHEYPISLKIDASNILVQTDGGVREEECAAASWMVGLWDMASQQYEPLLAGGTYLTEPVSVFMAEAIALDEATVQVKQILRQY